MARTSKPWWRAERGQWFVQHKGRQVPLGPDHDQAKTKWHTLMALAGVDTAGDANPFKIVADERLEWIEQHKKPKTYEVYRMHLQAFTNIHGDVPVGSLKPLHVDAVLKQHPDWSKSTVRGFMVAILSCLNWAVKQGYTTHNPLAKKLSIPPIISRGKEAIVSDEDYRKMIAHARPGLRDFLVACRNTGTRPIYVAEVEARHFHEHARCWVFDEHKTVATGDPLVVHLNDTMMEMTRKLIAKHPKGPLFRNGRGNRWTDTAWGKAMAGLRKFLRKNGVAISGRGIMYGFRHSFATELLEQGVPDAHAAALLGHRGTVMIHKHYSHLTSKAHTLKVHLKHIGRISGEEVVTGGAEVRIPQPLASAAGRPPDAAAGESAA